MDILPIEITKSEDVLFVKSQLSIFSDYFLEIIKIYNLTIEKNNDIALKLAKLKEKYNDLTKNNTNKVFLFCLNSLYFQYKILNFELENFNKLNSLIQNRMYGDYYKLYNIIINQCKENNILFSDEDFVEINNKIDSLEASEICEEDNIPPSPLSVNAMDTACNDNQNDQEKRNISDNNFPIYKDIDPFFRYKIEDVISLHQRILIIVDKLDNIYRDKHENIIDHKKNVFVGYSLSIFLNTLEYENLLLKGQINLYMEYISFYHISHKSHLATLLKKNTDFLDDLDLNVLVNMVTFNMVSFNNPIEDSLQKISTSQTIPDDYTTFTVDTIPNNINNDQVAFDSPLQSDDLEFAENETDESIIPADYVIDSNDNVIIENLSDNMLNVWNCDNNITE